mgnify:FL=1
MEKGIIIYKSKYGAAKKYAQWLQRMTGFQCIRTRDAALKDILQYDTIVLCSSIYASGIAGLPFLKKNIDSLRNKKIAIFCVGASPYDESAFEEIKARNLTGNLKGIPLFYGRGAWDLSKMTFIDRTICKMLQRSISKKDPDTYEPWMKALMCSVGKSCDWTDEKYLLPLLDFLRH